MDHCAFGSGTDPRAGDQQRCWQFPGCHAALAYVEGAVRLLASDPALVQAARLAERYQAKRTTGSNGAPLITGRISKTDYWVYFEDCSDGANCKAVQFHCGHLLIRPIHTYKINDFNSRCRFIRPLSESRGKSADGDADGDFVAQRWDGPKMFVTDPDLWRRMIGHWERQLGV